MNPVIEELCAAPRRRALPDGRPGMNSAVQRVSGQMLYDRILECGYERTLEVGLAYGLSALFICQAHADRGAGAHIAVDPCQSSRFAGQGLAHLERAGLAGHVTFFEAPSYAVLPRLVADGTVLDFAFIDGRHLFDYTLVDFFYIDLMLRVGGEVAIDDLWLPGVRTAVSYILRNRAYDLVRRPASDRQSPRLRRLARVGRRYLQQPLGGDGRLKRYPLNTCLLRKRAPDERASADHVSF